MFCAHRIFRPVSSVLAILLLASCGIGITNKSSGGGSTLDYFILGQPNATSVIHKERSFTYPYGITTKAGKFIVADFHRHRVLIWNSVPTSSQQSADLVVGQDSFAGTYFKSPPAATNMYRPIGVETDGTRLVVVEYQAHRVLIWNTFPTQNGQPADLVLGQPDFTTRTANQGGLSGSSLNFPTTALILPGPKLMIADYANHRILYWTTWPTTNGQAANLVIGQANLTSNGNGVTTRALNNPQGLATDGTRLFITDRSNNRVLIYNSIPSANQTDADLVLGQPDMTSNTANNGGISASSMYSPVNIVVNGGKIAVTEYFNNRTLIWNALPVSNGQAANVVLGQNDFTTNDCAATPNMATMCRASGVDTDGTALFISTEKTRVLKFNTWPTTNGPNADLLIGQPYPYSEKWEYVGTSATQTADVSNVYCDGTHLFLSDYESNRILIWNNGNFTGEPSVVLGQANFSNYAALSPPTASSLNGPAGMIYDGTHFIATDYRNHRVLIWNSIPTTHNQAADLVLGQPDMISATANNGGITRQSLSWPYAVYSDGTRLFVADSNNSRLLIWNTFPTVNRQAADVVLGQPNFTSGTANNGGISASTFAWPAGVTYHNGRLYVADNSNNRVLIWNTLPTANGQAADVVLGQTAMTAGSANGGGSVSLSGIYCPNNLVFHDEKLYLGDFCNNRVMIWNNAPTTHNEPASSILGQTSGTTNGINQGGIGPYSLFGPNDISFYRNYILIIDYENRRLVGRQLP